MEDWKEELKERFFERFFYAEDGSRDWDRWRNQDPDAVWDFIQQELSKAREEGIAMGFETYRRQVEQLYEEFKKSKLNK